MPRVVFTSGSIRVGASTEQWAEYFTVNPDVVGTGDKTFTVELSIIEFAGAPVLRVRYPADSPLIPPAGTIITSDTPVGVGRFTLTGTINVAAGTPANVGLTTDGTTASFRFQALWAIDY